MNEETMVPDTKTNKLENKMKITFIEVFLHGDKLLNYDSNGSRL